MGAWRRPVRRISRGAGARRGRCWLALVVVAVALAACAPPAASPARQTQAAPPAPAGGNAPAQPSPAGGDIPAPLQPLRVVYPALSSGQAPLWIGVETGLFREQGLDVEALFVSGSDRAIAALLSGEVPITILR